MKQLYIIIMTLFFNAQLFALTLSLDNNQTAFSINSYYSFSSSVISLKKGTADPQNLPVTVNIKLAVASCSDSRPQRMASSMKDKVITFNSAVWKAQYQSGDHENPRRAMVSAVEEHVAPTGMPRSKVVEALGPPDEPSSKADVYNTGASAFGVDFEQFIIEYDDRGNVSRSFVRRR